MNHIRQIEKYAPFCNIGTNKYDRNKKVPVKEGVLGWIIKNTIYL